MYNLLERHKKEPLLRKENLAFLFLEHLDRLKVEGRGYKWLLLHRAKSNCRIFINAAAGAAAARKNCQYPACRTRLWLVRAVPIHNRSIGADAEPTLQQRLHDSLEILNLLLDHRQLLLGRAEAHV